MGEKIPCPFMYSNGQRCTGHVYEARAYGPKGPDGIVHREDVKKYRLWCSEKGDHAGAVRDWIGKERMEFYPDQLPADTIERLWSDFLPG
jgi:hypothetical protein